MPIKAKYKQQPSEMKSLRDAKEEPEIDPAPVKNKLSKSGRSTVEV